MVVLIARIQQQKRSMSSVDTPIPMIVTGYVYNAVMIATKLN